MGFIFKALISILRIVAVADLSDPLPQLDAWLLTLSIISFLAFSMSLKKDHDMIVVCKLA